MMKVRYIHEKFTENSDPIEDMGIGIAKLIIEYTEDSEEFEIIANFGKIIQNEISYVNLDGDAWDKIDTKKIETLMYKLDLLLNQAQIYKNGNIGNPKIVKKIKKILEEEITYMEFFGGETYNGWDYEQDGWENKTHEEAVLSIAVYCIGKSKVFLDYKNK